MASDSKSIAPKRLFAGLLVFLACNLAIGLLNIHINARLWPEENRGLLEYIQKDRKARSKPSGGDSWYPMVVGYDWLKNPNMTSHTAALYSALLIGEHIKIQYPPSALLVCAALDGLWGAPLARVREALLRTPGNRGPYYDKLKGNWYELLNRIGGFFYLATALFVSLIFCESMKRYCPETWTALGGGRRWALFAAAAVFGLAYYPSLKAYTNGQIQAWLNALTAAALWLWLRRRAATAGSLIALNCLIKPQSALLALWALPRRQWRFVAAFAAVLAAGLLLSLALFGFECHRDYLKALSYLSRHGESYYPNQSFNGLMHRLLGNGNNTQWMAQAFPPYNAWVYGVTLVTSLAMIGLVVFYRWRGPRAGMPTGFALGVLITTLASPIAWEHHYGSFAALYALALPALLRWPVFGKAAIPLLALSYVLTSNFFQCANLLAQTPFNFIQSYALGGALILLALLCRLISREQESGDGDEAIPQ